MLPTADHVARAIVAAAREAGADPLDLLASDGRAIGHGRVYAGFALRKLFPACPSIAIGRMVGSAYPKSWLAAMIAERAKGRLRWFDDEALARVVAAVGKVPEPPPQVVVDETISGSDGKVVGEPPAAEPAAASEGPCDLPALPKLPPPEAAPSAPAGPPAPAFSREVYDRVAYRPQYGQSGAPARSSRDADASLREAIINTGGKPVD